LVSFGGVACVEIPDEFTHKIAPESINLIFKRVDETRAKIKKDIDELARKNILRVEESAQRLREAAKRDILEIEAQLNKDINTLVDRIDEKYRSAARELFQQINKARAEALADVRYSIGFVDEKLEARITQMSLTLMEMLTRLDETADKFKPEKLRSEIIEPTFAELDELTDKVIKRIDQLVDKIGCKVGGTVTSVEESLERVVERLPFSKSKKRPCQYCKGLLSLLYKNEQDCSCCQKEKLLDKNNNPLITTNIKLFRHNVCMLKSELDSRLNDNTLEVQYAVDTYATIQQWAMDVYCKSDLSMATATREIMKEEAAQAHDHYLFWSKRKRKTK
jgi:DNA-binding ferritin-like protein